MSTSEQYPDIPSSSGASFKTLGTDEAGSTPMRTGSPTPVRDVNERSKLLDRSEGGEYVGYGAEQAERIERRRRSSGYAVVNTEPTSGAGSTTIPGINDDDVGESRLFCPGVFI